MKPIYEIPNNVNDLFTDESHYKIIDYTMNEMDNIESMKFFIEQVGINPSYILLNDGTQVHFTHPNYNFHIVVDSGGLGDFHSHLFEVSKVTFQDYKKELETTNQPISSEINGIIVKNEIDVTAEDMNKIFIFLYIKR